jgi:aldehyde:ferredoxin oxidoreductase
MEYCLDIDLKKGKAKRKKVPEALCRDFIGGRGLGIHYLYRLAGPRVDPLSEENVIIFAVGPLCGTASPSSGLFSMTTRSPLTGTCLSAHSGGYFGPKLNYSGYDAMVIRGAAEAPCYLLIDGEETRIESAGDLWGRDAIDTVNILRERHGDVSVLSIGQAGEKRSLISAVINDAGRAAARGGPGAVMGVKKLKAIAVKGGIQAVEIADKELFQDLLAEAAAMILEKGAGLRQHGTPAVVALGNQAGFLPTRNFQTSFFPGAEKINAEALNRYKISDKGCFGCSIVCSKIHKIDGCRTDGPEYETVFSLGSNCGNSDVESLIRQNDLCNRFGLDTISAGVTISFLMELYEKGIVTSKDVDNLDLSWGNVKAQEELLRKMAFREGIGDVVADGTRKAAERIGKGAIEYAVQVKGMEFPGYEPRTINGVALAFATSNRGACHLRAMIQVQEAFLGILDRFTFEGKSQVLKKMQDDHAVVDSLVMCKFTYRNGFESSPDKIAKLVNAVTGWDVDGQWILMTGERIYNLERLYNQEAGIGPEQDCLPDRFFKEKIPDGPCEGRMIDRRDFDDALKEYYTNRGWDENGRPTPEKLEALRISDY